MFLVGMHWYRFVFNKYEYLYFSTGSHRYQCILRSPVGARRLKSLPVTCCARRQIPDQETRHQVMSCPQLPSESGKTMTCHLVCWTDQLCLRSCSTTDATKAAILILVFRHSGEQVKLLFKTMTACLYPGTRECRSIRMITFRISWSVYWNKLKTNAGINHNERGWQRRGLGMLIVTASQGTGQITGNEILLAVIWKRG